MIVLQIINIKFNQTIFYATETKETSKLQTHNVKITGPK